MSAQESLMHHYMYRLSHIESSVPLMTNSVECASAALGGVCSTQQMQRAGGAHRGVLLVRVWAAQQDDIVQQVHEAPPDRLNLLDQPRRRARLRLYSFNGRLTA